MAQFMSLLLIISIFITLTVAGKIKEVKKSPKTSLKYTKQDATDFIDSTMPPTFEETTDIRFLYQCLDQHNQYRKNSAPEDANPMDKLFIYSTEVERIAQRRALKVAVSGKITVDSKTVKSLSADGLGENVAFTSVPNMNSSDVSYINCRPIVDLWYMDTFGIERESVSIETESAMNIRQTSQARKLSNSNLRNLIWNQATEIGCAQVASFDKSNSGVYTLCNYKRSS